MYVCVVVRICLVHQEPTNYQITVVPFSKTWCFQLRKTHVFSSFDQGKTPSFSHTWCQDMSWSRLDVSNPLLILA